MSDAKPSPSLPIGANNRTRLIDAFSRIMLSRPQGRPSTREVIEEAGVARSTLYEHFGGRDDLLLEALRHALGSLADAGAGQPDEAKLVPLLEHLRERRADMVSLLGGPLKGRILRTLSSEVLRRDPGLSDAGALQISAVLTELVRLWVSGDTPAPAQDMAAHVARAALAHRGAIGAAPGGHASAADDQGAAVRCRNGE